MAGLYLGYPFDADVFNYNWQQAQDPTLTAMFTSGAVVADGTIAQLISNGSDVYSTPFYKVLGGTEDNYDGQTNITATEPSGGSLSGIVYGRAHGWTEKDFVKDYNSKADPMTQITSQVAKFWQKRRQEKMLGIANACFAITGQTGWANHTTDLSSSTTTVTDANRIGATTINDAITKANGDNRSVYTLALMHSHIASQLEALNLLTFRKYTDALGIERQLNIADCNGLTVIVDDGAPYTSATEAKAATYTTYLMGAGALRFAPASVEVPSEVYRQADVNGGQNTLYTRIRETLMPNGFSYTKPAGATASVTNTQLFASANWSMPDGIDPKLIAMSRIITSE